MKTNATERKAIAQKHIRTLQGQVKIADAGNRSLITVSDAGGNPLKPAVATALLERLKSEFER